MEWVEFTRFIKDVCSIALPLKYSIFPFLHEKKVQTANRLVCTLFDNGRIIPFGRSGWCNTIQQEDFKLLGFSFEMDAIPQGGYLNPIAKTVDDFAADVNFSSRCVGLQPGAGVYRVADCGEIHAHFGADVAHYRLPQWTPILKDTVRPNFSSSSCDSALEPSTMSSAALQAFIT